MTSHFIGTTKKTEDGVTESSVWRGASSDDCEKQAACADVTCGGRPFQIRAAATGKARSPMVDNRVTGSEVARKQRQNLLTDDYWNGEDIRLAFQSDPHLNGDPWRVYQSTSPNHDVGDACIVTLRRILRFCKYIRKKYWVGRIHWLPTQCYGWWATAHPASRFPRPWCAALACCISCSFIHLRTGNVVCTFSKYSVSRKKVSA